jgi:RNA polymerase sigma factor (sigma-70 family)
MKLSPSELDYERFVDRPPLKIADDPETVDPLDGFNDVNGGSVQHEVNIADQVDGAEVQLATRSPESTRREPIDSGRRQDVGATALQNQAHVSKFEELFAEGQPNQNPERHSAGQLTTQDRPESDQSPVEENSIDHATAEDDNCGTDTETHDNLQARHQKNTGIKDEVTVKDSVQQYGDLIKKLDLPLLSREQEEELARTIEIGVFAEQIIRVAEAKKAGTIDQLREQYYDTRLKRERQIICESDGKKAGELTDFDIKNAENLAKAYVDKLISVSSKVSSKFFDLGEAGIPETTMRDSSGQEILDTGVKPTPIATREELEQLITNSEVAFTSMVEHNLGLAFAVANKYRVLCGKYDVHLGDVVNASNLGLIHAVEKFDHTLGWKFSTYATKWCHQQVQQMFKTEGRLIQLPGHVEDKLTAIYSATKKVTAAKKYASDEDVAAEAHVTIDQLEELRRVSRKPISLQQPVNVDGTATTIGDLLKLDGVDDFEDQVLDAMEPDSPEYVAELRSHVLAELIGSVEKLSANEQQVVILHYLQDKSHTQIAGMLGLPTEQAARQAAYRAIEPIAYLSTS